MVFVTIEPVKRLIATLLLFASLPVAGQVEEIRSVSKDAGTKSSKAEESSASESGSGIVGDILLFLPHWQQFKLHPDNRQRYPMTVSLEAFAQGGYKGSETYLFWPRMRANWGLFSTDYRMNWIFEKNSAGNLQQIHTNDWQVLQLNITTSRFITVRVGAGVMTETFGNFNQYSEFTAGLGIHAPDQSNVFYAEYRDAWKSGVDTKARIEFSAQYQHEIVRTGAFHTYLTVGAVYQKYYGTIDFWGVQAGVLFKLFRAPERN